MIYLFNVLSNIIQASQLNSTVETNVQLNRLNPLLHQELFSVSIDEIDSILEHLYEIRNRERGIISNKLKEGTKIQSQIDEDNLRVENVIIDQDLIFIDNQNIDILANDKTVEGKTTHNRQNENIIKNYKVFLDKPNETNTDLSKTCTDNISAQKIKKSIIEDEKTALTKLDEDALVHKTASSKYNEYKQIEVSASPPKTIVICSDANSKRKLNDLQDIENSYKSKKNTNIGSIRQATSAAPICYGSDESSSASQIYTQQLSGSYWSENEQINSELCDKEQFKLLLFDVWKNIAYYRFNICKILVGTRCCLYNKSQRINKPSNALQKKTYQTLINLSLMFVRKPECFVKTDPSIFLSNNSLIIQELRARVPNQCPQAVYKKSIYNNHELQLIKEFNSILIKTTRETLMRTTFYDLVLFCNTHLGFSLLINRYYDMFVGYVYSLYKISSFLDKKFPEIFKIYLSCPPLPKKNFYNNYSVLQEHSIFFWVFDWLYYFSNYCKLPTKKNSPRTILFMVRQYPKEFFIQVFLVIYLAIDATRTEFSDIFVDEVKKKIKRAVFYVKSTPYKTFLENIFFIILKGIQDIYSYKIYNKAENHALLLMRTTEEHIKITTLLDPVISHVVEMIFNLIKTI